MKILVKLAVMAVLSLLFNPLPSTAAYLKSGYNIDVVPDQYAYDWDCRDVYGNRAYLLNNPSWERGYLTWYFEAKEDIKDLRFWIQGLPEDITLYPGFYESFFLRFEYQPDWCGPILYIHRGKGIAAGERFALILYVVGQVFEEPKIWFEANNVEVKRCWFSDWNGDQKWSFTPGEPICVDVEFQLRSEFLVRSYGWITFETDTGPISRRLFLREAALGEGIHQFNWAKNVPDATSGGKAYVVIRIFDANSGDFSDRGVVLRRFTVYP
jgi:hypothetical protein